MISSPPTYQVIYSAIHQRCGHETRLSDYRIKFREDLHLAKTSTEVLCGWCYETHPATHVEIVKFEGLGAEWIVPKAPIEEYSA